MLEMLLKSELLLPTEQRMKILSTAIYRAIRRRVLFARRRSTREKKPRQFWRFGFRRSNWKWIYEWSMKGSNSRNSPKYPSFSLAQEWPRCGRHPTCPGCGVVISHVAQSALWEQTKHPDTHPMVYRNWCASTLRTAWLQSANWLRLSIERNNQGKGALGKSKFAQRHVTSFLSAGFLLAITFTQFLLGSVKNRSFRLTEDLSMLLSRENMWCQISKDKRSGQISRIARWRRVLL
jgi:hypothetical protein